VNRKVFNSKMIGLGVGATALALVLAGVALAGNQGGGGHFGRGLRAALATVDLTQDQKDKIKASFEAKKPELSALREKAKTDREALRALVTAANPDPAAVGVATLKVHANRQAMRARMEEMRTDLAAILTPEQVAKLDGWIAAHRQHRAMLRGGPAQN